LPERVTPEIRIDQLTGLRSILAPGRAERPEAFAPPQAVPAADAAETCPFCEGREDRTPPEVWADRAGGGPPDAPGWSQRSVPNLYPALSGELDDSAPSARESGLSSAADPLTGSSRASGQQLFGSAPAVGSHEVIVNAPAHRDRLIDLGEAGIAASVAAWRELRTDDDAVFDAEIVIDASALTPYVTWGTNPGQSVQLGQSVPDPDSFGDEEDRDAARRALDYMGLEPATAIRDIGVDVVFLGSCTNGRIEDLRVAAEVLEGRTVAEGVRLLVVPGSHAVRVQAEAEGLDQVFTDAGGDWRLAGCSMCLGMNPDQMSPLERCASTSNRNFEGRQGARSRTHLVSPSVAAATAVLGTLASPADLPPVPALTSAP